MDKISDKVKELENRLAIYDAIMRLLDVGVHVVDTDRKTIVYNEAMARMEGEDPNKILGTSLLEGNTFFKEKESTLIRALESVETVGEATQNYLNSRGHPVVTVNKTQPIIVDGEMVGAVELATDVTYIQLLSEKIMDLHEVSTRRGHTKREKSCAEVRYSFDNILGRSPSITLAKAQAKKIAKTSSNVLICGETGTGKELFAQSIHAASNRRGKPFIDINCAALPSHLLEGLLFGSVRGGFTDAQDRPGLFEQAHGGTLLLDEINSMDMALQGKLLRALQEKKIRRLGATSSTEVDVRVISTINKTPEAAMDAKELREDLFYRLSVTNLNITPLRHRQEDIPVYVDFFLKKYAYKLGLNVKSYSAKVLTLFQHHPWPGNIRQLEHAIEGALNLVNPHDETLLFEHLPPLFRTGGARDLREPPPAPAAYAEMPHEHEADAPAAAAPSPRPEEAIPAATSPKAEKQLLESSRIREILERNDFNISKSAREMGVARQLLQYKIKKYGLRE